MVCTNAVIMPRATQHAVEVQLQLRRIDTPPPPALPSPFLTITVKDEAVNAVYQLLLVFT